MECMLRISQWVYPCPMLGKFAVSVLEKAEFSLTGQFLSLGLDAKGSWSSICHFGKAKLERCALSQVPLQCSWT